MLLGPRVIGHLLGVFADTSLTRAFEERKCTSELPALLCRISGWNESRMEYIKKRIQFSGA